jgi:hypothetical protein
LPLLIDDSSRVSVSITFDRVMYWIVCNHMSEGQDEGTICRVILK